MAILKPQIQAALRESGILSSPDAGIDALLEEADLGTPRILAALEELVSEGSSDAIKLRAAECVLKLKGLMKDQQTPLPSITFVIQDKQAPSVNPILFPREMPRVSN